MPESTGKPRARTDAERMDWLERCGAHYGLYRGPNGEWTFRPGVFRRLIDAGTARGAIDRAMDADERGD